MDGSIMQVSRRLFYALLVLAGLRLFYAVPLPGIRMEAWESLAAADASSGFFRLLSGTERTRYSLMALNITPYITAGIVMQLLGTCSERIHEMQRGRRQEQNRMKRITAVLGLLLAFSEGFFLVRGYEAQGLFYPETGYVPLLAAGAMTAGTGLSILAGNRIQKRYGYNGSSFIILMNLLASYPSGVRELYETVLRGNGIDRQLLFGAGLAGGVVLLFALTYVLQETEKRLPVCYADSRFGGGESGSEGYFPVKLCPGGVVPVIFASTILGIPSLFAGAAGQTAEGTQPFWQRLLSSSCWFRPEDPLPTLGALLYVALIVIFSFFQAAASLDPAEIAADLSRSGGTVAGIRPGKTLERYLKRQQRSLILWGALALSGLSLLPMLLSGLFGLSKTAFFGTSVIITVGVFCEVRKTLLAEKQNRCYRKRSREKGGLFS